MQSLRQGYLRTTTVAAMLVPAFSLYACSSETAVRLAVERDTLPDGRIVARYGSLSDAPEDTIVPDVRIGVVEGTDAETFGDVRGIEIGTDGTIYVLDYQAAELRAFSPEGAHRATLTRKGSGPSELLEPNGMVMDVDGTLWIQDHGQSVIIGLSSGGEELDRLPMLVPGYGYIWRATLDDSGIFWQGWSHSDPRPPGPPEAGMQYGVSRRYYKSYDPRTEAYDSIYLGQATFRSYVVASERGYSGFGLPFDYGGGAAVDRTGRIWLGAQDAYRLARLDVSGDTVLMVEVNEEGPIITAEERDEWLSRLGRYGDNAPRVKAELAGTFPERKPALEQLVVDDENRIWIRRSVAHGQLPRYDVFDDVGTWTASVRIPGNMSPSLPPVIRAGRIYFLTHDSLYVSYVMAGTLPAALTGGR